MPPNARAIGDRRSPAALTSAPSWCRRSSDYRHTPGSHRDIVQLARPGRSGGPGHPDWLQGCAPSTTDQSVTGSDVPAHRVYPHWCDSKETTISIIPRDQRGTSVRRGELCQRRSRSLGGKSPATPARPDRLQLYFHVTGRFRRSRTGRSASQAPRRAGRVGRPCQDRPCLTITAPRSPSSPPANWTVIAG